MRTERPRRLASLLAIPLGLALVSAAQADPCGMVPPVWIPDDGSPAITRIGLQQTYAFYKDGVETIVLRPGFEGRVDEFGMLIPFPSPPTIRKVHDDTFAHLRAAVDPPDVQVRIYEQNLRRQLSALGYSGSVERRSSRESDADEGGLAYNEVRVLKQEAVGMYEVAVLEAGSSAALSRWMEENEYRYPEGMDDTVDDYVALRWCFVAVKTKVGQMPGVTPSPGMRSVDTDLPAGSTFDGHVQGMGFRFHVDEPVIPMRLSTFNGDDLHNVVYLLSDKPMRLQGIDNTLIKRQVPGDELYENLTEPLDLIVHNGSLRDLPDEWLTGIAPQRDPSQYNGIARDLFAADLLAVRTGELALAYEEESKELLNISEALGLRGAAIDAAHDQALASKQSAAVDAALADVKGMTLTVIDGDFPKDFLRDNNLFASAYAMPDRDNQASRYQPGPDDISLAYYRY